ncbi:MAG: hypothetical protein QGI33_04085 [Candidatus Brocadiia bacterium]|nr:hypothetical protein [Candidatus Brocadiia bacterium]
MTTLTDESRKAVDDYLRKLEAGLTELSEAERADAVAETRSHIEEAVARIREDESAAVGTVLRGLGEPEAFAEGLVTGDAQEEPVAEAVAVPVASAAAPVRRRSPVGWWIAGCLALPVVAVVAWVSAYFALSGVQTRGAVEERKWLAQEQEASVDYELTALRDELLRMLVARDAAGMAALRHPELMPEDDVSGEDLLLPEGPGRPELVETARGGPNRAHVTVHGGGVVREYHFELFAGTWYIWKLEPAELGDGRRWDPVVR